MIRVTFKDGKTKSFSNVRLQHKDHDRVIALFDKDYKIVAEFRSEDVVEWLETPENQARNQTASGSIA